jgi:2-polyprenyl-3-methyl-5-hydroxy-6-metoxy-1,4-benzoquinol methylase
MFYDPIKDKLGAIANRSPLFRRMFYAALDTFFLRTWHVKRTIRGLFATKNQPLDMLDAGTGFGQYAWFMVRTFPKVNILAVDVKQDYLDDAKRFMDSTPHRNQVQWQFADLTQFQSDQKFDFILSVDVMEHIEDDEGVFRNFEAALKPNGYVLINTPSDLGGSDVEVEGESFISEHVRDGYNLDELKAKLQRAGLTTVQAKYTYGTFGSLAWRWLIKYPMKMLASSKLFALILPFYYIFVLPFGLILNYMDVHSDNKRGTGVLVVAQKQS